eukprot:TRINITY_DN12899_c0_g1_i1.p1 TRINITY_DN12899_c0_g1~~TRINITY_DN12899_c0_g1_i1.p1  ORF type:complete len:168 (+),score=38.18 TRINITY_DN12899_c0_g1_i1:190-693(+)
MEADRRRLQRLRTLSPHRGQQCGMLRQASPPMQAGAAAQSTTEQLQEISAKLDAVLRNGSSLERRVQQLERQAVAGLRDEVPMTPRGSDAMQACDDDVEWGRAGSELESLRWQLNDREALLRTLEDIIKVHIILHPGTAKPLRMLLGRRAPVFLARVESCLPPMDEC